MSNKEEKIFLLINMEKFFFVFSLISALSIFFSLQFSQLIPVIRFNLNPTILLNVSSIASKNVMIFPLVFLNIESFVLNKRPSLA